MRSRCRIFIVYLLTGIFLMSIAYSLLMSTWEKDRQIERLRYEVNGLERDLFRSGAIASRHGDTKYLDKLVEKSLKTKVGALLDDLYAIKKQVKASECMAMVQKPRLLALHKAKYGATHDKVNYAAIELGARIYDVIAEPLMEVNMLKSLLALSYTSNPPVNMIKADMDAGSCFAYKHVNAKITLKLGKEIYVEAIAVEHIVKRLAPQNDTSCAPKRFHVYGLDAGTLQLETHLGSFDYANDEQQLLQEFATKIKAKFLYVRFKIESNHGNANKTCIYRLAVYGKLPENAETCQR